jgi:hypothetical protein
MTPNQYRAALARLELTQLRAARLFGVGERTARRWAETGPASTAAILLRAMVAGDLTVERVEALGKMRGVCT